MSEQRISRLLVDKPNFKKMKKPDPMDPQKYRVYKMERLFSGTTVNSHMELDELQRVADYACRKFRVKRVGVTLENKGRQRIFGWCKDYTIHLNRDYHGDNLVTLLHELAHYITDQKFVEDEAHGPFFVGTYGRLLDMFNVMPDHLFFHLCDDCQVRYA